VINSNLRKIVGFLKFFIFLVICSYSDGATDIKLLKDEITFVSVKRELCDLA
jgi:hypothetical protein